MFRFFTFSVFVLLTANLHGQADSVRVHSIREVEVTAAMRPAVTKTVTPMQSLHGDDIYSIGIQSPSDAVRRFSGAVVKDYGGVGGMKTVSLRGMGAQHTAVSYDGITQSNAQSGVIDIGFFSLDNVSGISLAIGQPEQIFQTAQAYASSGILSIETAAPHFSDKSYKGNFSLKAGSFGYFNPAAYYARKLSENFSASANASWERTDGKYPYELPDVQTTLSGKRANSDVQIFRAELNLYGKLGKAGQLKVKLNYFDSEKGIPGAVVIGKDFYHDRLQNRDFFLQAHYKNRLSRHLSWQSNLKFSRSYYRFRDAQYSRADSIVQLEYYGSAGILYEPLPSLSLSLTEDIAHNSLENNFVDSPKPSRLHSLTLLAAQYKTARLTLTGSLLATYSSEKTETGNAADDRHKITPFIGISFRPLTVTDLRLRSFYKKIFRIPTLNDLYYRRWGNYGLEPEYTTQYNIGLTWSGAVSRVFDYLSVSADGYRNRVNNKIVPFFSGPIFIMRNYGEAEITGLDVNLKMEASVSNDVAFQLWGTYGYQKVLDVTDKTNPKTYRHQLPYTPRHFGSFALSCNNPCLNISYTAVLSGMQYWQNQNKPENELSAYSDHTLSLNKAFKLGGKDLKIQFNLLNIWNKNYQIVHNYPMPGRSFSLLTHLNF
ncbi:MAG: TonB-dependent receptor [Prevotella sp.]|jgi:outer membrane cobalamin receptor|nr:TonB-dependent receptor [Prevotella sp.]